MQYRIAMLSGEPRFESLGVIKLRCATSVPVDDRIFAQAQIGRNAAFLFLRLWSFETAPSPDATLLAHFSYQTHTVALSVTNAGDATLLLDNVKVDQELTAYQVSGEDLQGEYWGAVLMLPVPFLIDALSLSPTDGEVVLSGNLLRKNPAQSSAVPEGEAMEFLFSFA